MMNEHFRTWLRDKWYDHLDELNACRKEAEYNVEEYFAKYKWWLKREYKYQNKMSSINALEYKNKWFPGFEVSIHSELDVPGKDWCRHNLDRRRWSMSAFTSKNKHTFHFEIKEDARKFYRHFLKR
jgi:hypothetical protein